MKNKKVFSLTIVALMITSIGLLTSCGSDSKDNTTYTAISDSGSTSSSSSSLTVTALMTHMIGQMSACPSGETRMRLYYQTSTIKSTSSILTEDSGTTTAPTDEVAEYYLGVSASSIGDMMMVFKMEDGGFYIGLGICPVANILTSDRPKGKFYAPAGITLASNTTQGFGSIVAAKQTFIWLEAYNNYQALWFGPTTFYPVNISN